MTAWVDLARPARRARVWCVGTLIGGLRGLARFDGRTSALARPPLLTVAGIVLVQKLYIEDARDDRSSEELSIGAARDLETRELCPCCHSPLIGKRVSVHMNEIPI